MLFLDLDNFKAINDTLGHAIGDKLLKGVTKRLRSSLREEDAIARLGSDEFAIVQAGVNRPEEVAFLARRLIDEDHAAERRVWQEGGSPRAPPH